MAQKLGYQENNIAQYQPEINDYADLIIEYLNEKL